MKSLIPITASLFALSVAACGNADETPPGSERAAEMPTEMVEEGAMDQADHAMGDGIGRATGTIRSVGSQGDFLTIEHGEFAGDIQMGAMTMGFDIMGEVDLSGLAEGDEVAFMVKQGRDGSYRIMAICNTAEEGADCLDGMMDP